jgi:hypothetical protein
MAALFELFHDEIGNPIEDRVGYRTDTAIKPLVPHI